MSRIIQQIATVQFQVDNRKVTASMNALQTEAESLNGKIAAVNQSIKALGDVPADNKFLLDYQKQLNQLKKDLDDVKAANRDLMKGVKAADQLWKAAKDEDIERLSIKAIKAGQNGLRKRMDNLRPELGGDEQKMYDAYKAVIDEADRVMNVFKSNYATVVQTIRDGGIVSEQAMKSTRDALHDLMEAEKEGTAEHRQLAQQYDFLNESLANVAEIRRREKGEIVNANDARREALKLTEDGIAAARRERDMADAVIGGMQQQKSDLDQLRRFHEDRIAQTEREIAANQRLEEAEQDRLADVEKAMRYTENEDRKEAIRLRKKADAARDEAEAKKDAYEEQAEQEKLLRQHVKDTGDEVTNLTAKIEALGKTGATKNPTMEAVKQGAEEAKASLEEVRQVMRYVANDGGYIADAKLGETANRMMYQMSDMSVASRRSALRLGGFTGIVDKNEQKGGYMGAYTAVSKKDLDIILSDYFGNMMMNGGSLRLDNDVNWSFVNKEGKLFDVEDLREFTEKEKEKMAKMTGDELRRFVMKLFKEQFGEVKAALGSGLESRYWAASDGGIAAIKKVADVEVWKNGEAVGVKETLEEANAREHLVGVVQEQINEERGLNEVKQQSTTATNDQTEAEKLYNQKVEERIRLEKELEAIKNRSWEDDPELKRLDKEIAKLDELIAVSGKYKKQFAKMSDSKFEEGYMGGDSEVREAFYIKGDPQKSIFSAADYLKGAYIDRSRASLAEFNKKKDPDSAIAAEYQKAAERVAKGIVQNAQENFRRAIYKEIQDGNWTAEAMEQQLDVFRSKFQIEFRNARPGQLKNDPEYQYYKYVIEQMEKYIEVARQVEAEREKIAGGKEYMEIARQDDVYQQEGLLRQREKRDWDRATIKTEDIDRRRKEDERVATEAVTKAKGEEAEAHRKLNEAKKESTQTDQQSVDVAKQKAELEGQLADATKEHTKAQKDYEAQQEKTNKAQEKAYKAQEESVALNEKAATAEEKVAHQEERHAEAMDQQSERLRQIRAEGERLLTQYEQQKTEIQAVDKAWADADVKQGEAEARKAQNQELTIKSIEDSIRKLKEANAVIDTNSDEWEENTRIIRKLQQAQDEISQKQKEMMGEWMSYAEAMKYANSIGVDGFIITDQQTKMATDALTRHREELIKTIQQKEIDQQTTTAERDELAKLDQALTKIKTGFTSADDVLERWAEHMEKGKNASEGMAHVLDEKLNAATSIYDENIKQTAKEVDDYEKQIQETTEELEKMEKELAELEKKHANSSWFRKQTSKYQREEWRIDRLRDEIGEPGTLDDGTSYMSGKKGYIDFLKQSKQDTQKWLDYYKQQKAKELGLSEEEIAAEEKKAETQKLTNEQMQQGIKLLEEEYAKTDHTTGEGIKKRQQLREAIDQMNQELKESTGEWMSVADAMKLAGEAEKNTLLGGDGSGFTSSAQDIQKATQALERQRDALLQTIKAKRDNKNLTKEEKAALDQEEAELADLTSKLKALKFEQDNFNMSQAKMQELMRTPTNAVSLDELKAAIKRADGELKRMQDSLGKNNKEYKAFAEQVRNAKNMLKEMEGQAKASATAWEKAWSRLKTYVVMYMGFNAVWQKMMGTADDLLELSDKMGEVRKTTGFTADEVGRLSDSLKKLDTRTTITGLLDLSVAAGQLGLKTEEDVLGFTEAANKLMVALPEMGREGATEMLKVALATGEIDKIRKQMQEGIIDGSSATAVAMEKVGSTIDRLRATSAATAPAITDFVKRVGAVGAQSGITIDQVAALGSTVDALGMRVEMSATALSRMIPAIKNNAFDVAKAIGVAPEYLRGLFDEAGGGMKAMLMIFQHIKDSGMSEDNIEKMLGMGNLKEIMKELNQQGARAGIVFSGLSQNVDTLREHLGTASDAYRENVAIQQEYEKMNETTMAKWERLKNEIEEMFVGDGTQRFLGGIIDGIREIVDLLTGPLKGAAAGLGAGLSTYKLGLGSLLEKMWDFARGEEDVTEKWEEWTEKLKDKDVWGIVTSGVIAAGVAIYTYVDSLQEAAREAAKFARDVVDEQNKVENLTKAIGDAKTKVEEADKEVEKARKAVDEAKKSLDGTKESTDRLTEANSKLLVSEEKKRNEMATQKKLIETFNNEYGKYLGFMLSEVSSNYELIKARDLANTKLREAIALKRKEAALGRIEESEGEGRDEAYAALSQAVSGSIRKQVVTGHDKNGKEIKTWANDQEATTRLLRDLTKMAQAQNMTAGEVEKALADAGLNIYVTHHNGRRGINAYGANLRNLVMNYHNEYQAVQSKIKDVETQFDVEASIDREEAQDKLKEQFKASEKNYADLETSYAKAQGDARKQAAANLLKQADTLEEMISTAPNYYDLSNDTEKAAYEKFVTDTQKRIDGIKGQRESLLKEAGALYKSRKTVQGETTTSLTPTSPWGGNAPADSTDYGTWDVNELVARRNQMDKFKNVLKPDTDIRAVLAEDKALMKALDNGLKEDWKSVIGWYNTERKKIQEELKSERFSTNEGHWRDEKQGRGRKNRFRESDYALAELDRYYSKRKEELEKARIEENMSEELFNRQAELLEQEHLERRSKLRETFTAGSTEQEKKMVKQFREWWSQLEKQGLLDEVPWATVESEWSKALASEIGRNNLRAQQDMTQMEQITVKHLNAIAKIIEKERPYDGIVANLRKNLTEIDILFADLEKKGTTDPATLVKEQNTRLQFLLGEAETAYQSSIDDVLRRMADAGMTAWAEEISKSDAMKNALMAQLQSAYDEIQDAIKKEASQIKKQTDIWWNDLMPGQDTSRKGGFEKMLSRLGLQEDQVKRANQLIGAGAASERVADKLAIKQMQIRLQMQQVYYTKMRQMWDDRIRSLREQGKEIDAQHAEISKQLSLSEEQKKLDEQRVAIANQLEESQNRLYTSLKEWGDLLASSVKDLMEASHAGDAEYYNELAKYNLTGKGGPGAGTYVVIDNAGTSDAKAHYEYLDEREALERQHEIEQKNAQAEAWKKVMDDLNAKMNEQITDWMNAAMQNQSIDANTDATLQNTEAIVGLTQSMQAQNSTPDMSGMAGKLTDAAAPESLPAGTGKANSAGQELTPDQVAEWTEALGDNPMLFWSEQSDIATQKMIANMEATKKAQQDAGKAMSTSAQSTFAKMTTAANLYGIAYQAMSNDNLTTEEKFEMFALQAAGQAAIGMLTTNLFQEEANQMVRMPGILGKLLGEMPYPAAMATYAVITALMGGLMGMAVSQVGKSKSQIAQVTGASASAGKLTTGMKTYAEGNVNELTDPSTLTPGRQYNVDGADGKTYRARYMGVGARTHITNGPEFHLVGEKGREAIIDAHTTRNIQLNEPEIWGAIKTLYNGGSLRHSTRRRRGVRAYADGNIDDFGEMEQTGSTGDMDIASMKEALDRNSAVQEALLERLNQPIYAQNILYGADGLPNVLAKLEREAKRHGEKYL